MNGKESLEALRNGFDENDRLVAALAKKFGVKIDMNDKQQLAAMGEHVAEQAGGTQPLCMAKRLEELEGILREVLALVDGPKWQAMIDERKAHILLGRIDEALSGKLPDPAAPEGWQLVPAEATRCMMDAAELVEEDGYHAMYSAMLAAAPKPDTKP